MQRTPKPNNHRTGCGLTNRREITQRQQDHRRSIARRGRSIEQFDLDPLLSESEDEDYQLSASCHIEMLMEEMMEEMRTLQARLNAAEDAKKEALEARDKALRENERLSKMRIPYEERMNAYKCSRAACGRLFGDMIRLLEIFHQISTLIAAHEANFTIYGSAVRKLLEFISNPICDQGEDFGSYPRDIDIKVRMPEQQFKLFHQLFKTLVVKRLGMLEDMQVAIAEVSNIEKLENTCRGTTTTRFTMVLHDKRIQKALPVDISLDDGNRTNDYNVNGLMLSKHGIKSTLGDKFSFLEIARSIVDREAINLQNSSSSFEDHMPSKQDISMMLRGLKLPDYTIVGRPIVSWQEDIVYKEDSALSFEMLGCRCTGHRYLSLKTLAYMLQNRSRGMICPMCRDSFRGIKCTPAPEKSKKMEVENLFMLADKETSDDYKTRSDSELKTYLSVSEKKSQEEEIEYTLDGQPVRVDGKVVKHSDIEDFLGLVRGDHQVSGPKEKPKGWIDVFRSSGCTCSSCTRRRGGRSYDFY